MSKVMSFIIGSQIGTIASQGLYNGFSRLKCKYTKVPENLDLKVHMNNYFNAVSVFLVTSFVTHGVYNVYNDEGFFGKKDSLEKKKTTTEINE